MPHRGSTPMLNSLDTMYGVVLLYLPLLLLVVPEAALRVWMTEDGLVACLVNLFVEIFFLPLNRFIPPVHTPLVAQNGGHDIVVVFRI